MPTASAIDPVVERQLLASGLTYEEIAVELGGSHFTVRWRDRRVHRVDRNAAFTARVRREGIPVRLNVDAAFGHYAAGLFDGEGSFVLWHRTDREQRVMLAQIGLRDDDIGLVRLLRKRLGGLLCFSPAHGATNPAAHWRVERLPDLAEIVVPLFDRHPLRSRKAQQFLVWREIVLARYAETLRGTMRMRWSLELAARFRKAVAQMERLRRYTR